MAAIMKFGNLDGYEYYLELCTDKDLTLGDDIPVPAKVSFEDTMSHLEDMERGI